MFRECSFIQMESLFFRPALHVNQVTQISTTAKTEPHTLINHTVIKQCLHLNLIHEITRFLCVNQSSQIQELQGGQQLLPMCMSFLRLRV